MTTTKTKPLTAQDRFGAAQERLDKAAGGSKTAQERLAGLRERHIANGDVTAEEFAVAAAALELADLDRQGAEADFTEAQQAARLEKLAEIRADIEAQADPDAAAAAFELAVTAFADLLEVIGPKRGALVSRWAHQLMSIGIQPAPSYNSEPPAPENDGFASRQAIGGGQIGSISLTTSLGERRVVRASFDMPAILASLVDRACTKAHTPASLFELERGHQPLAQDPGKWFRAHN